MNTWSDICHLDDLTPNSGRCALHGGEQVAIFRVREQAGETVYAVANHDPFSGANVISRGIVGSQGERTVVASPLYKQRFCLRTGECLDDTSKQLKIWQARIADNRVQLAS